MQKASFQPCGCATALAEAFGLGPLNVPTNAAPFISTIATHVDRLEGAVDEDGAVVLLAKVGGAEAYIVRTPDSEWGVVRQPPRSQGYRCVREHHDVGS